MKGQIYDVRIEALHPFEGHPYKVQDNADMDELVESIRENGVLTPILVRHKDRKLGTYEIVSGHRRVAACKKLGITDIPAQVTFMERDEAIIALVDSNLHRDHILPSEKAFAYKLKLDALAHRGQTCGQVGHKSREEISDTDSGRQVQRYIRLTNLIPELLQYVDDSKIALTPAVELSFLPEAFQRELWEQMQLNDCTPSYSQANQFKKAYQAGTLTADMFADTMAQEKANQKAMFRMPMERIHKVAPSVRADKLEDFVLKACAYYQRYLDRNRDAR